MNVNNHARVRQRHEFQVLPWRLLAMASMIFLLGTNSCSVFVSGFCPEPTRPRQTHFGSKQNHSRIATSFPLSSTLEDRETLQDSDLKADMSTVRHFTEVAIFQTSSADGLQALEMLSHMCQQRLPYVFDSESSETGPTKAVAGSSTDAIDSNADGVSFIRKWKQLYSSDDVASIKAQIHRMEENGWWSTNPDSVDGLPSFHLNLVSDGKPLFPVKKESQTNEEGEKKREFERGVQDLSKLVCPRIYEQLLPKLQQEWLATSKRSTSLQVSDIFVRRYGKDLEDVGIEARQGISAHYDVYSKVTAVVALDDVAAEGTNGLYTICRSTEEETQGRIENRTKISSNHAALRRFVPLQEGDAVLHTWDILHGVDVELGLDRTSLIIWFTEASVLDQPDGVAKNGVETRESDKKVAKSTVSPWLLRHPNLESDDVAQFVLASSLSSSSSKDTNGKEQNKRGYQHELYLKSAATGNSFALTSVGSLIEEGALSLDLLEKAERIADDLRSAEALPVAIQKWKQDKYKKSLMAMRFWLEGAARGNPLAQKALADELMFLQSSQPEHDSEVNTLAATLFALAAQQGDEEASDSLSRVIEFAVQCENIQSQEEFMALDAVQVANAATSS